MPVVGADSQLNVIYLGNEGFYISSDSSAVVIDGLHQQQIDAYQPVPAAMRENILKGATPFERLDLLLVTHYHSDHFDADLTDRLLEMRPLTWVVAPQQAARQ